MSKPTFDSIASAKAKLAEELRKLEAQEANLLEEEASHAFLQVSDLLGRFGQHFTAKQKADIAAQVGGSSGKKQGSEKIGVRVPFPTRQGNSTLTPVFLNNKKHEIRN